MYIKTINGNIKITIDNKWYEISNEITQKILNYGECENETEETADQILSKFIKDYIILHDEHEKQPIKRVIWNELTQDFQQLQALKHDNMDVYTIQYYNSNLQFIEEIETNFKNKFEVLEFIKDKNIVKGLQCSIFKSNYDCTNNGISSNKNNLYLIDSNNKNIEVAEVDDIRDCVIVDCIGNYTRCKPIIFKNKWYMAGGNYLYTSDSRFREVNQYPIAIHDRLE